jgi:hypothetical protein
MGHSRTVLIASSNTVFSPFCVNAEHSRNCTHQRDPMSFVSIRINGTAHLGRLDLRCHSGALRVRDGGLPPLPQLVHLERVIPKVKLGSDQKDRGTGRYWYQQRGGRPQRAILTVMLDFWPPLISSATHDAHESSRSPLYVYSRRTVGRQRRSRAGIRRSGDRRADEDGLWYKPHYRQPEVTDGLTHSLPALLYPIVPD